MGVRQLFRRFGDRKSAEKKLFNLRKLINVLYFEEGFSKRTLVQRFQVSKKFVIRWTKSADQDFDQDLRGWPKGRGRRWGSEDKERIRIIHKQLISSQESFFWGATAVDQQWRRIYPDFPVPPLRTIGQILSELGLSQKKQKPQRGASRYLCYPEHTIYDLLGYRLLETDFIGKKFLAGSGRPLNFVGFAFKKSPRLRYFLRTPNETTQSLIHGCEIFFKRFEIPSAVKMDNGPAMQGSGSGKRTISAAMTFLLKNKITPIFSVPRRPFTQASIEGNNSIFSRKFWNRRKFQSLEDVDQHLELFNLASEQYLEYRHVGPSENQTRPFIPKIFFIRQVRQDREDLPIGSINVLNEKIELPAEFINYFVLAEWNLKAEKLNVYLEKELQPELIHKCEFKINTCRRQPISRGRREIIDSL
ncbi:MAG: hypothetical protein LC730_01725 [Acidobacteria bacterium]|nr:hypothetical protein [Acidobacteriota bacterium]